MGDKEASGGICECSCLETLSDKINGGMAFVFRKLGYFIGQRPAIVMVVVCLVAACFIPGMVLFFETENDVEDLWVPTGSQAVIDADWVSENFPTSIRVESVYAVSSENILTPEGLQELLALDTSIKAIVGTGEFSYSWTSICAKLGVECWSNSILELWEFNSTVINALTQEEIISTINTVDVSPVYSNTFIASQYLLVTNYNGTGNITEATAASFTYVIKQNSSLALDADTEALDWEQKFIDLLSEDLTSYSKINTIYFNAFRSFGDAASSSISGDLILLFIGYGVIIAFVSAVLGNFSVLYHRVYVALGGVMCVGLAIVVSYGLCLYLDLLYGPVHSILPFLMIGIGVDDMFVIVQALDQLTPEERAKPIPERIADTLAHAGVSITVTSLTDIVAFAVGASTVLPALQSFCLYACVGILFIYLFQATFFVACIVYDERRRDASRDACVCCYTHEDYEISKCGQRNLTQYVFDNYYGPLITKLPFKIGVLVTTLILVATMAYGLTELKQYFDPIWFLPSDSAPYLFSEYADENFPTDGISTAIYIGEVDYYADKWTMEELYEAMNDQPYTSAGTVDSFHHSFWTWLNTTTISATYSAQLDAASNYPTSETNFYNLLDIFLQQSGARFLKDIKRDSSGVIYASRLTMKHKSLVGASDEIEAMDGLRAVASAAGYGEDECFAYSREYLNFETNKVIQVELFRNLGVAFACVLVMTFILIASPVVCLFVCLCVILVLIDVAGTMYFWGLTIDTVTSVILILAIGLAVDYSAHIGETFLMETGTRNERIKATMSSIGPAVFYGGFSTFLAFVLLAGSKSYIFTTFFKVFFCVVLYGMFHGLVFLPVVLSWVGPQPYLSVRMGKKGHGAHAQNGDAEGGEKLAMENGHGRDPEKNRQNGAASPAGVENAAVVLEDEQLPSEEEKGYEKEADTEKNITPVQA